MRGTVKALGVASWEFDLPVIGTCQTLKLIVGFCQVGLLTGNLSGKSYFKVRYGCVSVPFSICQCLQLSSPVICFNNTQ